MGTHLSSQVYRLLDSQSRPGLELETAWGAQVSFTISFSNVLPPTREHGELVTISLLKQTI